MAVCNFAGAIVQQSLYKRVMNRRKIVGVVFIVAALLKLADMWGVWNLDWMWQHPWPTYFGVFFLLYIGVELIISSYRHHPDQWLRRPLPIGDDGKRICCSVRFGGDEYIYHGEAFHGARLDAFCGGLRLDLREATITEDEELDIHTFCGGVEVLVPKDINVVTKSHNFIGGINDETSRNVNTDAHTLHIIASNFIGGVAIK